MHRLPFRYAILGFLTHALVILLASVPGWRATPLVSSDAVTYMMDARNILQHGVFSREQAAPYLWEPYRTPGYPLVLAFSILVSGGVELALFFSAAAAGLAAWVAIQMSGMIGCDRVGQHITGLVMILLPNSLGLSAFLLTDALFGYFFLIWIFLLYKGFRESNILMLIVSIIVLFILQAIKPTANLGILFIGEVAILWARTKRVWLFACLMASLALLLPITFSSMNYRDNQVFSPTLLDIQTAREYLQVRYISEQTGQGIAEVTNQVRLQDHNLAEFLSEPKSYYGRLYYVERAEVVNFIQQHPWKVLQLMGSEMVTQFAAPQEWVFLVFRNNLPTWLRALGSLLTLFLWIGAGLGALKITMQGDCRLAILLISTLLFFLVTGSVSDLVGARLRFPADLLAVPFFALCVSSYFPQILEI